LHWIAPPRGFLSNNTSLAYFFCLLRSRMLVETWRSFVGISARHCLHRDVIFAPTTTMKQHTVTARNFHMFSRREIWWSVILVLNRYASFPEIVFHCPMWHWHSRKRFLPRVFFNNLKVLFHPASELVNDYMTERIRTIVTFVTPSGGSRFESWLAKCSPVWFTSRCLYVLLADFGLVPKIRPLPLCSHNQMVLTYLTRLTIFILVPVL
jgi:hypothetical protein